MHAMSLTEGVKKHKLCKEKHNLDVIEFYINPMSKRNNKPPLHISSFSVRELENLHIVSWKRTIPIC
jgi:hypothetical protein